MAGAVRAVPRLLHDPGRLHDRLGRDAGDHRGPRRRRERRRLGDQRLPAGVRRPGADHRPARRPVRAQDALPGRADGLHARVPVVRSDRLDRGADRGPGRPGPRRLDDDAADDGDHHPDLPGRSAAARRWRCGAPPPASPRWSARSSAACWSTRSAGSGSSSSTSRSAIVGFVLALAAGADAARPTPTGSTGSGVALSGVGMFLLVFGIQEGHQYDWGTITGPITVWRLIIAGLVVLGAVRAGGRPATGSEPLVPLGLFRDRNFSLANVAISTMGFAITAMGFPLMLYAQLVRGLSPTEVGAAAGADGADVDRAGAVGRQAHRPGPPAADHRRRLRAIIALAGRGCPRVMTPDVADLGDPAADGAARHRQRLHLGAHSRHRDPQPADAAGRRRRGRLQRHPPGRRRARLGGIAVLMDARLAAEGLAPSRPGQRGGGACRTALRAVQRRRWRRRCCCRRRAGARPGRGAVSSSGPRHDRRTDRAGGRRGSSAAAETTSVRSADGVCRWSAGSRRPRRRGRPCRPRRPCPRRAGRRPSCCRPRRRP